MSPLSCWGQEVKVIYRDSTDSKGKLDTKDEVYDVLATGATKVVETTKDAVSVDGTTLKVADLNGGKAVDYAGKTISAHFYGGLIEKTLDGNKTDDLKDVFNKSSDKVTLIVDDKDVITHVFVEEAGYAFVNKLDIDKGQFSLKDAADASISLKDEDGKALSFGNTDAGKEKLADYVNFVNTVEEGDFVKVTASIETGALVYSIEALEPNASGEMTIRNSNTKATIDGTAYEIGAMAVEGFEEMPALNVDEVFYVYTDGKYAVYVTNETGATSSKVSGNMAYVINAGTHR